jgi:SAM-dependent methyltransferase
MITQLPRVIAAPEGKPTRPGAAESQRHVQALARDAGLWTRREAGETARRFDELAATWDAERGGYRTAPLSDALARGGPLPPGPCAEIGSGTGLLTSLLERVWSPVVCVDLSWQMLVRATVGHRVQADASSLPVASASVSAVVVGDAPLFAAEVARALAPGGVLVWTNALGPGAPFYVPADVIAAALADADPASDWPGVHSDALWGRWAVFHRSNKEP